MKDRMDFIQILSLLIAGAFLISAIMPASASTGADGQTQIASIFAAYGAADTFVGHETIGTALGITDPAWPGRGTASPALVDRDALLTGIRPVTDIQPGLLRDPGYNVPVTDPVSPKNRSAIIDDLVRNRQNTTSGTDQHPAIVFPDSGFRKPVIAALSLKNRSAIIDDLIRNRQNTTSGTSHLCSGKGIVRFIDLEGGFYGIIASTGEKYFPLNLAPEFRTDGLQVEFRARERRDISTTAMWGIPVELISIRKMDAGMSGQAVLLEFSRDGGFTGCSDHLVLYDDGSARISRKEYTTLVKVPKGTLDCLVLLLSSMDETDLQDEYAAPQEGADYYSYSLTIEGKFIRMDETAVPDVLVPVIELLTDIIIATAPDDVIPPLHS